MSRAYTTPWHPQKPVKTVLAAFAACQPGVVTLSRARCICAALDLCVKGAVSAPQLTIQNVEAFSRTEIAGLQIQWYADRRRRGAGFRYATGTSQIAGKSTARKAITVTMASPETRPARLDHRPLDATSRRAFGSGGCAPTGEAATGEGKAAGNCYHDLVA